MTSHTPGAIREDVWIPMPDGISLAATVYRPDPAHGPQPCLIEALPYRKDDVYAHNDVEYMRLRDEYDYAVCRIDVRGTGSSGGRATDEYPDTERTDIAAAMRWLAGQPWCTGDIGMYGTSYSACAALLVACERPPELKAIIAIQGSDQVYTDDVHYRGGALQFSDLVDYCNYMTSSNALPPTPAVWGDGWRDEWHARLAEHQPWLLTWMREQRDSEYWQRHAALADLSRIACPTMVVAGWADGYRNGSFRVMEALKANGVPHRLLAGPWAHGALDSTLPGPRLDEVAEEVRWWDRWLRRIDNGVDDGLGDAPSSTLFVRTSTVPAPDLDTYQGFWIREQWPCPRTVIETLVLNARDPYPVNPAVGVDAWIDCAGLMPWGQSGDLRYDDAASLTWDFDGAERAVIGHPVARLRVSVDQPVAYLSVKLNDVFPDGTSALVSRGLLNLTHRDSHAEPTALTPGDIYEIDVELDACAYRFEPGQRLRLSVAGADWPNNAAPPAPLTLTVHGGELDLPCWSGDSPFGEPEVASPANVEAGDNGDDCLWQIERDVLRRTVRARLDYGSEYTGRYDQGIVERNSGIIEVNQRDFRQRAEVESVYEIRWSEATVRAVTTLELIADADNYDITIDLVATENGTTVAERRWHETSPRDLA